MAQKLRAIRTRLELATTCVTGRYSNQLNYLINYAEEEGFEPPVACTTPVFKTGPFDHSGTPLNLFIYYHDVTNIIYVCYKNRLLTH